MNLRPTFVLVLDRYDFFLIEPYAGIHTDENALRWR